MTINVVENLVRQILNGKPIEIFHYSKNDDFNKLWEELDSQKKGALPWPTCLIIFDGTPSGDLEHNQKETPAGSADLNEGQVRIEEWLTPWDWALAVSLRLNSSPDRIPKDGYRCLILDLLPGNVPREGSGGRQRFKRAHAFVPWVRWYRPLSESHMVAFDYARFFEDLQDTEKFFHIPALKKDVTGSQELKDLDQTWGAMLAAPSERHQVSNLVGPIILAEGLEQLTGAKLQEIIGESKKPTFLKNLLSATGLLTKASQRSSLPNQLPLTKDSETLLPLTKDSETLPSGENDIFGEFGYLRFLLVDDQFHYGYHKVLQSLIFGPQSGADPEIKDGKWEFTKREGDRQISLICHDSPDVLLQTIEAHCDAITANISNGANISEEWEQPRIFGEVADHKPSFDILLLDLRLFQSREKELPHLQRLVNAVEMSRALEREDPSLEKAYWSARDRLAQLVDRNQSRAEELEAYALLSLIINRIDPSLPIIIFSSTQQRVIMELFQGAPAIITIFSKAAITGYAGAIDAVEVIKDLRKAFKIAIKLHEARTVWNGLVDLDWNEKKPVFRIKMDKWGNVTNYIYNCTTIPDAIPPFENIAAPRKSGHQLRSILAWNYIQYIEGRRFFDFASIPWETLEGNLTPAIFFNEPDYIESNILFNLDYTDDDRNQIAQILKLIRHKKAHGYASPPRDDIEEEEWRLTTILLFMVLLDFIKGSLINRSNKPKPSVEEIWACIKIKNEHLYPTVNLPEPKGLLGNENISLLDFTLLLMTKQVERRPNSQYIFLSEKTFSCIYKLAQKVINDFWGPIIEARDCREILDGTVLREEFDKFLIKIKRREGVQFIAVLPKSNADLNSISINGVHSFIIKEINRSSGTVLLGIKKEISFQRREGSIVYASTVKWFNEAKGYGFIRHDDGPDWFVHHSNIVGTGSRTLKEDDKVKFEVGPGPKGLQATKVTKATG